MLPEHLRNRYFEVAILLSSFRALQDARTGISRLRKLVEGDELSISEWRVDYIGACALLRASVHLFGQDAKACHNERVSEELTTEWQMIKADRDRHSIYWSFINKERNAILKEYHWTTYMHYFDEEGMPVDISRSILSFAKVSSAKLKIRGGEFDGRDSTDLLQEAADWVEQRIVVALDRAGYKLRDRVHFRTWAKEPKYENRSVLSDFLTENNASGDGDGSKS